MRLPGFCGHTCSEALTILRYTVRAPESVSRLSERYFTVTLGASSSEAGALAALAALMPAALTMPQRIMAIVTLGSDTGVAGVFMT
jgi:hypothetical protein